MKKLIFLLLIISRIAYANPPGTYNPLLLSNCGLPVTVTFDANATSFVHVVGVTTVANSNLTIGTGNNRALIAQLSFDTLVTGVTCNWDSGGTPQSMTLIDTVNNAGSRRVDLWGLVNPTSGNKTLTCNWTGSSEANLNALSFTNVNQTGGTISFPNSVTNTGTSTTVTNTVSSTTSDAVVDSVNNNGASLSSPTQTQTYLTTTGSISSGGSRSAGASSVTFQWTNSVSNAWGSVATSIRSSCPSN